MKPLGFMTLGIALILSASSTLWAGSPGDTVGITQYEIQAFASAGNRIALDPAGGIHITWTKGQNYNNTRGVIYDYRPASGQWSGGSFIDERFTGYPRLALAPDGCAVIAYHKPQTGAESLYCAVDAGIGFGTFDIFRMPAGLGATPLIWPEIAVDRAGRIHAIATQPTPAGHSGTMGYTRSNDNGVTWLGFQPVDTVFGATAVITASRVSDKVAIVYCHPIDTANTLQNDIYFVQSVDGVTWDFAEGRDNLTNYARRSDSVAAFIECDAVYDYNDDLHFIWTENILGGDGQLKDLVMLVHYSVALDIITPVYLTGPSWPESGCIIQSNDRQICKLSLGVEQTMNTLFTIYTRFDSTDCSNRGDANGDIYMQLSANGGHCWTMAYNVTNSRTPDCITGECDSDNWASLAEVADEYLHILYVNDKEAGVYLQEESADDIMNITFNPVLYLAYPNPILLNARDDNIQTPESFQLLGNYPNPFNARTTIEFIAPQTTNARLAIYDIAGRQVDVLLDGPVQVGRHRVVWDAGRHASGIYFARAIFGGQTQSSKMILLK